MVILGAMLFRGITILICGAVTFDVINDYERYFDELHYQNERYWIPNHMVTHHPPHGPA